MQAAQVLFTVAALVLENESVVKSEQLKKVHKQEIKRFKTKGNLFISETVLWAHGSVLLCGDGRNKMAAPIDVLAYTRRYLRQKLNASDWKLELLIKPAPHYSYTNSSQRLL